MEGFQMPALTEMMLSFILLKTEIEEPPLPL